MSGTRVAIRGATLSAVTGLTLIGAFVQAASAAPSVVSESASQITASDATLEATIATQPGEEAINQFQLATSPGGLSPEFHCPREFVHSSLCLELHGETPFPVQFVKPPGGTVSEKLARIVTLSPRTTYYYRIITAKTMETLDVWVVQPPVVYGATQSFTTPDPGPPPIKRFPKIFINGMKAGLTAQSAITVGEITLHNGQFGNVSCRNMMAGKAYNELTEGTEKGFLNPTSYATYACNSQLECNVENTKGERVPGIYLTAESPPVVTGTEAHETGISSLPWTGELIERETGKRQVLTHHVKIWLVAPPSPPGKGPGCSGIEVPFEDQEGPSEKEAGDELAPIWVNGTRNGLKPSHLEFIGIEGTEKTFPVSGRLISAVGPGFITGAKLTIGGLGGAWELVNVE